MKSFRNSERMQRFQRIHRIKIDSAMEMLAHETFRLKCLTNVIVRKLIDCVKVLSKEKLLIVFKGGVEVKAQMEK